MLEHEIEQRLAREKNKHRPDRLLPFERKNRLVSSREEERLKQSHPT